MRLNWSDATLRFVEARLITGAEYASLFAGIGIEPTDSVEPSQIVEAITLDDILLVAARLAAGADGVRTESQWVLDALDLWSAATDHDALHPGEPIPPALRRAAIGLGVAAEAAATLMHHKMLDPLTPIEGPNMTPEQVEALIRGESAKNDAEN